MRLLFFLFLSFSAFSQNVFDASHTKSYASHLLNSGQYELASKELERLHFFEANNDTVKTDLLKAYRLSNKADIAYAKRPLLFSDSLNMPRFAAIEYTKLLFTLEKWEEGSGFWNTNTKLNKDDAQIFEATKLVFTNKLDKAREVLNASPKVSNLVWESYSDVLKSKKMRKSPGLAALLSVIVPGAGKVYAKDWKDGLISLIFTATMTVQSVRNFNRHGFNDARGYIYGAIGSGFYLGNIYGSVQSAKNYNLKQIDQSKHEISAIFNSNY